MSALWNRREKDIRKIAREYNFLGMNISKPIKNTIKAIKTTINIRRKLLFRYLTEYVPSIVKKGRRYKNNAGNDKISLRLM
ncbi:MAG: hypothetical protein OIN83_12645 [Candidatus Methanoperedens sp.]|nr:hypothetical protein [Candidatus Methanoperedens sp.]